MPRGKAKKCPRPPPDEEEIPEPKKAAIDECSKHVWYPNQAESPAKPAARKSSISDISTGDKSEDTGVHTNEDLMKMLMELREEHKALGRELQNKMERRLEKLQEDLQASFKRQVAAAHQDMLLEISQYTDSYEQKLITAGTQRLTGASSQSTLPKTVTESPRKRNSTTINRPVNKGKTPASSHRSSTIVSSRSVAESESMESTSQGQLNVTDPATHGFSFTVGPSISIPPDNCDLPQTSTSTRARRKSSKPLGNATSSPALVNIRESLDTLAIGKAMATKAGQPKATDDPLRNRDVIVMVSGISETEKSNDDLHGAIDRMIHSMGSEVANAVSVVKVQRMSSQQEADDDAGDPRLVKIAFESLAQKALILRSKYKLANSADYSHVEIKAPSKKDLNVQKP